MKANYSPELRTKLFETNLLNFDHITTDQLQHRKLYWRLTKILRHHSSLKLWVATLFCVAISWQLNAASYLHGVHKPCPLLREEAVLAVRVVNLRFRLCTSLATRPMIVASDLGTRLHVRIRTKLENGVFHNGQPPQSVVSGLAPRLGRSFDTRLNAEWILFTCVRTLITCDSLRMTSYYYIGKV